MRCERRTGMAKQTVRLAVLSLVVFTLSNIRGFREILTVNKLLTTVGEPYRSEVDRLKKRNSQLKRELNKLKQQQHDTPKVYHLCAKFGDKDDHFLKDVNAHVDKVIQSGVFGRDEIIQYTSFPSFLLNDTAWKPHLKFLRQPDHITKHYGAGYWFWKPALIHHHLQNMQDGDFLLYSDTDRVDFLAWTNKLLDTMVKRNADLALEEARDRLENVWTKGDIYTHLCPGLLPQKDTSPQYSAAVLWIRKNVSTVKFFKDWTEAAKNYHSISDTLDEPSVTPNAPAFKSTTHDQSLMSSLFKCSYHEPEKTEFPWTCLEDWMVQTFRLHDSE